MVIVMVFDMFRFKRSVVFILVRCVMYFVFFWQGIEFDFLMLIKERRLGMNV